MDKLPWVDALSSGGLHQTGKDAVGFQSAIRSGSEADLAEDHQMPKRLFGVIVGGGYAGASEEGEEKFLLGTCEESPWSQRVRLANMHLERIPRHLKEIRKMINRPIPLPS